MEGQLKWVVSLLVIADDRERTIYIKVHGIIFKMCKNKVESIAFKKIKRSRQELGRLLCLHDDKDFQSHTPLHI